MCLFTLGEQTTFTSLSEESERPQFRVRHPLNLDCRESGKLLSPPKTANLSLRALGSTDTALEPRSRCETGASASVGLYAPWRGLEERPGSALLIFCIGTDMTQETIPTASNETIPLTGRQTLILLVSFFAILLLVLYLLYAGVAWAMGWNSKPESIPSPQPVILSKELSFNFLSPHTVQVKVRNDGAAGRVRIELRSWTESIEIKRSESGIEQSFRETFTTKLAPPPVNYKTKYHSMLEGSEEIWLNAGESKTVVVQLAIYNWTNMISGKEWTASAVAVPTAEN